MDDTRKSKRRFYEYDVVGDLDEIGYNYDLLINKPTINNVILEGDLSFEDLGIHWATDIEIKEICKL